VVSIPSRLQGAFRSQVPTAEEMRLSGVTDWGTAYVQNNATWIQFALARHWQLPDVKIPPEAQQFLGLVPGAADALKTWQAGEAGDKLAAISQGTYAAIDSMLGAMEATYGSIPLIGAVAKIGIAAQRIFWNRWLASVQPQPAPVGLRYDRTTDEKVQADAVDHIGTGDITPIFLPPVDLNASQGDIEVRLVQDLNRKKGREWLIVPSGPRLGLGFMPAGLGIPRSWQGLGAVLWSDYAPGAMSASLAAWELARGELAAQTDFGRIAAAWYTWWAWIQKKANELDAEYKASGNNDIGAQRNVLLRGLRPVSLEPQTVGQQLYGTGNWLGDGRGKGRNMGDVVKQRIEADRPGGVTGKAKTAIVRGRLPTVKPRRTNAGRVIAGTAVAGGVGAGLYFFGKAQRWW